MRLIAGVKAYCYRTFLYSGRFEVPCTVVCRGVSAVSSAHEREAGGCHPAAETQAAYRIVELLLDFVKPFAVNSEVENGLLAVLVPEVERRPLGLYRVGKRRAVFGQHPFVRALLAFGFCHRTVLVAPALIAQGRIGLLAGGYFHVYCRRVHIGPKAYFGVFAFNVNRSVVEL